MYTSNDQGCNVVMCCASCSFCAIYGDKTRDCTLHASGVLPDNVCTKWNMRPVLNKAGSISADGKVKKLEYLQFVAKVRFMERQLIEAGSMKPENTVTTEQLRENWEIENQQSIFMDI